MNQVHRRRSRIAGRLVVLACQAVVAGAGTWTSLASASEAPAAPSTSTPSCGCASTSTSTNANANALGSTDAAPPADLLHQLDCAGAAETAGDLVGADGIFLGILHDHPDEGLGWAAYGEFQRFLVHDRAAASSAFQAALHASHSSERIHALALKGLGDLAAAAGDSEGAIALMRQSLAVCPVADTHRALSVLLLVAHHDEAGAADEARLAVEATPQDPLSLLVYAILCERIGHHGDGRTAFTQALAIAGCDAQGQADHPVHCCVFYNSACYYAVCKERVHALTMLAAFFNAPNHLHRSRHEIENDPDLVGLLQDPDFRALMDRNLPTDRNPAAGR